MWAVFLKRDCHSSEAIREAGEFNTIRPAKPFLAARAFCCKISLNPRFDERMGIETHKYLSPTHGLLLDYSEPNSETRDPYAP